MDDSPANTFLARGWRQPTVLAALAIVVATLLAHSNSFHGPLVLDDQAAIAENRSIENWRNLGAVFAPPHDVPTAGRPLLNLSFALNYAAGGRSVGGYHVVNLTLHVAAALLLYGLVRRTLRFVGGSGSRHAGGAALAVALIWAVHPLHTASVSYLSQRAEVLMGFFFLLMLYAFARSEGDRAPGWRWVAVMACAGGVMTKETMVAAPVVVLLYDRTFFAGRIRDALRRRAGFYATMAATWMILAALMAGTGVTTRGIGYSATINAWNYALTECRVAVSYLGLVVWPHPLVFDYGPEIAVSRVAEVWPQLILLLFIGAGMAFLLRRAPAAGFAALSFFLLLAPTSSVVPVTQQPMAENRLYLPAAAAIALAVAAASQVRVRRMAPGIALLVVALVVLTERRNRDYQEARTLWADTVAKRPDNVRARSHLGEVLREAGDLRGATAQFEAALRLNPDYPAVHNNLGLILSRDESRRDEALRHFEHALRLDPDSGYLHNNLGVLLMRIPGREADALRHLEQAVRLKPDYPDAHRNLATLLVQLPGRGADAVREYAEAVRLEPDNADAHVNLGFGLAASGKMVGAIKQFETALRLNPNHAQAHAHLGNALMQMPGGLAPAIAHYRRAVELDPKAAEAWSNLGVALSRVPGARDEAVAALKHALELRPNFTAAQQALAHIQAGDR